MEYENSELITCPNQKPPPMPQIVLILSFYLLSIQVSFLQSVSNGPDLCLFK